MEALKLISLFILIYSSTFKSASADSLAAKAIVGIIDEHFARHSPTVAVISFGEESENVVKNVLRHKIDSVAVEVSKHTKYQKIDLELPSILFFDSLGSYVAWKNYFELQPKLRASKQQHLIYIQGATLSDIETLEWGFNEDTTNLLTHEGKESLGLVTGFMFGPSKCRNNQFAVINRFNSKVMVWENSTYYPDKYQNFHGCSLKIYKAPDCETISHFFDMLATTLNFKIQYFIDVSALTTNDLICSTVSLYNAITANLTKIFIPGPRIFSEDSKIIAPYGELLTPIEKMFMPFYFEVWVAILVTILMALCAIQIINRCTREVQNAFFGGNNNVPTLSLAELFLFGAQRHVPQRSPARFILVMMIIWCLIIRTCYQSELFKCLQSDARKPGVKSLADLIEQNFTLLEIGSNSHAYLGYYTRELGLPNVLWREHGENDLDVVAEPENKAFALYSTRGLAKLVNRKLRVGVPSFVVLDETVGTLHYEFTHFRANPFKKALNEKIIQLLEGGFMARWVEDLTNIGKAEIKRKAEIIGPQVLTMDHLQIGFKIWLVPLAFSVIVFAFEFGNRPCQELIRHIRDGIVARSVVHAFIGTKRRRPSQRIRARQARRARQKELKNLKAVKGLKHKIIIVKSSEK